MLRQVSMPSNIPGTLYLSAMPGRYESLERSFETMKERGISRIIRLALLDEVRIKSPDYYRALKEGKIPWSVEECGVPDYGVPEDENLFLKTVKRSADRLRTGETVLVHCGAGIGRTGMFAICMLMALGMSLQAAERAVRAAGSGPETEQQHVFLRRIRAEIQS